MSISYRERPDEDHPHIKHVRTDPFAGRNGPEHRAQGSPRLTVTRGAMTHRSRVVRFGSATGVAHGESQAASAAEASSSRKRSRPQTNMSTWTALRRENWRELTPWTEACRLKVRGMGSPSSTRYFW